MDEIDRLIQIMDRLRGPGGCPWDAEQDHKSIMKHLIEEAYELADAVDSGDPESMAEELGDVLLQVVFHSTIAKENNTFTLSEVINHLCDKLIHRHPHVFGDATVADSKEVIRNWERLKKKETGKQERESILSGVPESLPALLQAFKIQSTVSRVGFDWEAPQEVLLKIDEERTELTDAMESGDNGKIENEIGDLIFSVVNLARLLNIDPEAALRQTNRKFTRRFFEIEKAAKARGIRLADMPMKEKDEIWEASKDKIG
jgi:tetrapyrrole methylase family protein / MazG family protein